MVALVLGLATSLLDLLTNTVEPVTGLDSPAWHALGLALFLVGLTGTLVAQGAIGASWRIGVDESERTELVTAGPFAYVRNPIFAAMIPAFAGIAALVAAVEIQGRLVEEPALIRTHSARYAGYAARVGRFVPGPYDSHERLGRLLIV